MRRLVFDETDIRILCALQDHGELSKTRLAALVGLSPTPCWLRLSRLKKEGLIGGYHARIALTRIVELTKAVVTVSLKRHRKADFDRFETYILKRPEITDCHSTGGGTDYVMIMVTTRLAAIQALMEDMLEADLMIERYLIHIVTREIKAARPDLALLLSDQTGKFEVA